MPKLIDVDTGEEIDPSQLSDYEEVSPSQKGIGETLKDMAYYAPAKMGLPFLNSVGGLIRGGEDLLGTGTNYGEAFQDATQGAINNINQEIGLNPHGWGQRLYDIGTGLAPFVMAGPATGVRGVAALGGLMGTGTKYGELDQKAPDADPWAKAMGAGAQGVVDTGAMMLGMAPLLSKTMGPIMKGGLGLAGNYIGGQGSEIANMGIDSAITGEIPSNQEWSQRLHDRGVNDMIGTAMAGVPLHIAGKFANRGIQTRANDINTGGVDSGEALGLLQGMEDKGVPVAQEALPPGETIPAPDAAPVPEEPRMPISRIEPPMRSTETGVIAQVPKAMQKKFGGVADEYARPARTEEFQAELDKSRVVPTEIVYPTEQTINKDVVSQELGVPKYVEVEKPGSTPEDQGLIADLQLQEKSSKRQSDTLYMKEQAKEIAANKAQMEPKIIGESQTPIEAALQRQASKTKSPILTGEEKLASSQEAQVKQFNYFKEDPAGASVSNLAENLADPVDTTKGAIRQIVAPDQGTPTDKILTPSGENIFEKQREAKLILVESEREANRIIQGYRKSRLGSQKGAIRNPFFKEEVPVKELPVDEKRLESTIQRNFILPRTLAAKDARFAPAYKAWEASQAHLNKSVVEMTDIARPYLELMDSKKVDLFLEGQRLRSQNPGKYGKPLEEDPNMLKANGYSDAEIAAIKSVRDWSGHTLDRWVKILKDEAPFKAREMSEKSGIPSSTLQEQILSRIDEWAQGKREQNYVPFNRYGDWFVTGKSAQGEFIRQHFYTKAQAKEGYLKLREQGYSDLSPIEKIRKPAVSGLDNVPADIADEVSFIMGDPSQSVFGARKHLASATLAKGFDKNFKRAVAEYSLGLGRLEARKIARAGIWEAKRGLESGVNLAELNKLQEQRTKLDIKYRYDRANPDYERLKNDINAKIRGSKKVASANTDKNILEYLNQYEKDILNGGEGNRHLSTALFHAYLGFNPKSALVNLTQPITVSLPYMAQLDGWAAASRHISSAIPKSFEFLGNPEKFQFKHPELFAGLKEAQKKGVINNASMDEIYRTISNKPEALKRLSEMSQYMFSATENYNRVHAFVAGFERAKAKGMSNTEAQMSAEAMVKETQFSYGVGDKPQIARTSALGATSFIFRLWSANWMRHVIGAAQRAAATSPNSFGAIVKGTGAALSMSLPLIAMTGYKGLPAISLIDKFMASRGMDTTTDIRKKATDLAGEDFADAVIYGVPAPITGFSLSGSLGLGNIIPDFEGGIEATLGRLIGGVALDIPARAGRALDAAKVGKYGRAVEAILPEGFRNPVKAIREANEGVVTLRGGVAVPPEKISAYETMGKALGFPSIQTNKAYELQNYTMQTDRYLTETSRVANIMFADAMGSGDQEKARGIVADYASKLGISTTDAAKKLLKNYSDTAANNEAPKVRQYKSLPKGKAREDYLETQKYYR